jgi:hypothetical protein
MNAVIADRLFTASHVLQKAASIDVQDLKTWPAAHVILHLLHVHTSLLFLQVIKVYNVESEGFVYSAQVPLQDPIKKLGW